MNLDEIERIYSAQWFDHHTALRAAYHAVGDAIDRVEGGCGDVLDVGCGAAFVIERLAELGRPVRGLDGSRACFTVAPKELHDRIAICDFRAVEPRAIEPADLVVCLEVAEHIAAAYADRLVALLACVARRTLVFSAAPPGQGGHDHINEQPMAYWLDRFAPYGITKNHEKTEALRDELRPVKSMPWFTRTTVYLERAPC